MSEKIVSEEIPGEVARDCVQKDVARGGVQKDVARGGVQKDVVRGGVPGKVVRVKDVADVIRGFAPEGVQESWDNSGLCVGDENAEVTGVLLGFDCTPELVDEAVETGANLIVTHHPLIFGGLKRITPDDATGLAVMKAVRGGVAIYSAHTSADKVVGGVSWAIARKLGLRNIEILDPDPAASASLPAASGGSVPGASVPGASEACASGDSASIPPASKPVFGLGVVGDLPSPVSAEEAVTMVKSAFNAACIRASRPCAGLKISRIAACGGSGSSLISRARAAGAQLYISGDISYHHFFTPEGFMIMDIGHYESEIAIVDILFSLIKKNFSTFAVRITRNGYANPIYYF